VATYEVISECPVHGRDVFVRVEAKSPQSAMEKVKGMKIPCPWGPTDSEAHSFFVETVKGAYRLPWKPATLVSSAPTVEPLTKAPATPLETIYYINPDLADRQLTKSRWWEK